MSTTIHINILYNNTLKGFSCVLLCSVGGSFINKSVWPARQVLTAEIVSNKSRKVAIFVPFGCWKDARFSQPGGRWFEILVRIGPLWHHTGLLSFFCVLQCANVSVSRSLMLNSCRFSASPSSFLRVLMSSRRSWRRRGPRTIAPSPPQRHHVTRVSLGGRTPDQLQCSFIHSFIYSFIYSLRCQGAGEHQEGSVLRPSRRGAQEAPADLGLLRRHRHRRRWRRWRRRRR